MDLARDGLGRTIQVFSIREGGTLSGAYVPTANEVVCLGVAAEITVDTIAVTYPVNSVIGLKEGITYTFTASTIVHKM